MSDELESCGGSPDLVRLLVLVAMVTRGFAAEYLLLAHPEGDLPKLSAGILLFRKRSSGLQVLLVHPGGPFWKNKDLAAWSIPKGEHQLGEEPLAAAKREFAEETGITLAGDFRPLGTLQQSGSKIITAWALEGDYPAEQMRSNTFTMEWPPKSGRQQEFPEVDRAQWFDWPEARQKILKGQLPLLDRLPHLSL